MNFNENLKNARLRLNLKQNDIAKLLEVDTSTYCGYEIGKRSPDVARLKQLAEILKTSSDELIGVSKLEQPMSLSAERIIKKMKKDLTSTVEYENKSKYEKDIIDSALKIIETSFK